MSGTLSEFELTGRACTHVRQHAELGAALHFDVFEPYLALRDAAARDGIELRIVSGFRDFTAQLRIWNAKFRGDRPLLDESGHAIERGRLSVDGLICAILRWSALPGASRHHWGTDVDVIDVAAMPDRYRYQLLPDEYAPGGVFHELDVWLGENSARYGFFRPYLEFQGGVFPEPWHLSHAGISQGALDLFSEDLLNRAVSGSDLLGRENVVAMLPEIYRRYVLNIVTPLCQGHVDGVDDAA